MGERKTCKTVGRNSSKPTTRRYWAEGRYRKRRLKRIEAHILAHPNDLSAPGHLGRIEQEVYISKPAVISDLPGTKKKKK